MPFHQRIPRPSTALQLGKEEQKKIWQASGNSASLVQKGANAFALPKKEEMTKEEKKAKWMKGGGTLGLASKGLGALTFNGNKKKTQEEAYNIMEKCKTTGLTFGVANDLVPLAQLKITMDTAKVEGHLNPGLFNPNLSTSNFSAMNFSTPDFSTMNFEP